MKLEAGELMTYDNEKVIKYKVINSRGFMMEVINLGASITGIYAPDRNGKFENVVLNYKDYNEYKANIEYMGSIIGRTAGRIGGGSFTVEGREYALNKNNNGNTLHGGNTGFNLKLWHCTPLIEEDKIKLVFTCFSEDGDENFPGKLNVKVTYTIDNNNTLNISYEAETDKATLVNLTNHSYFNLSGDAKRKILNHYVYIASTSFLELDNESIPTGKVLFVEDTPFDFRVPKKIGRDINESHPQLEYCRGYDHPWLVDYGDNMKADVYDKESGRGMKIYTDCSALVMYTTNFPKGIELSNGRKSSFRDAVCFETQSFPVGHNNIFINDSILQPGEIYSKYTAFEFYVK